MFNDLAVAATALKVNVSDKEPFKEGFDRPKKPKKLKSMTTKSTMTNEDDYTTAHTTTPCTTPTGSQNDRGILGNINDETIEVTNKIVGWKITPRVSENIFCNIYVCFGICRFTFSENKKLKFAYLKIFSILSDV